MHQSTRTSPKVSIEHHDLPDLCFISLFRLDFTFDEKYNDIPLVFDHDIYKTLLDNGLICLYMHLMAIYYEESIDF